MSGIESVINSESILDSIKKLIGFNKDYTQFDVDVIININSSLSRLWSLGIGPKTGFKIKDSSSVWTELIGDGKMFENVKMYVYLKAKLVFDPPASSAVIQAYKDEIKELEWLLEAMPSMIDEEVSSQNG